MASVVSLCRTLILNNLETIGIFLFQLLVLSDLFVDGTHFEWVLGTLLDLHHNHSAEDDLLIQYLLPTLCKALAFLKTVRQLNLQKKLVSNAVYLNFPLTLTGILTSVYIFSIVFCVRFLWYSPREFVSNHKLIWLVIISPYLHDFNDWSSSDTVGEIICKSVLGISGLRSELKSIPLRLLQLRKFSKYHSNPQITKCTRNYYYPSWRTSTLCWFRQYELILWHQIKLQVSP